MFALSPDDSSSSSSDSPITTPITELPPVLPERDRGTEIMLYISNVAFNTYCYKCIYRKVLTLYFVFYFTFGFIFFFISRV
jgi:hypothetical protein